MGIASLHRLATKFEFFIEKILFLRFFDQRLVKDGVYDVKIPRNEKSQIHEIHWTLNNHWHQPRTHRTTPDKIRKSQLFLVIKTTDKSFARLNTANCQITAKMTK